MESLFFCCKDIQVERWYYDHQGYIVECGCCDECGVYQERYLFGQHTLALYEVGCFGIDEIPF